MGSKIYFTNEQTQYIINKYKSGINLQKLAPEFNCSSGIIKNLLMENNIILRKLTDLNRKYIIDEHYFDNIDCEEKAYFLGFLFSDGNVSSGSNRITLKLQKRDREILEKLKVLVIKSDYILKESENNYLFQFSGPHIKQTLINLGCIPNKSLKLKFPNINSQFVHHFIRGYFDGDGCISKHNDDYRFNFISTKDFCESAKLIIDANINTTNSVDVIKGMNGITSTFTCGGNRQVLKLMNWMYKDATIFLVRKHDKYLNLIKDCENIDKKKLEKITDFNNNIPEMILSYNSGKTLNDISIKYKYSQTHVYETFLKNNVNMRKPGIPKSK